MLASTIAAGTWLTSAPLTTQADDAVACCDCQEVLFDPATYKVVSRYYNLIAFSLDIHLAAKVLASAAAQDADHVEVKLSQRALPAADGQPEVQQPFLSFTARVSE
jgi:hypothetical protein